MKDMEGGSRLRYVSLVCLEGRKHTTKYPSRIIDIPPETLVRHFPDWSFLVISKKNRFTINICMPRPVCRVNCSQTRRRTHPSPRIAIVARAKDFVAKDKLRYTSWQHSHSALANCPLLGITWRFQCVCSSRTACLSNQ